MYWNICGTLSPGCLLYTLSNTMFIWTSMVEWTRLCVPELYKKYSYLWSQVHVSICLFVANVLNALMDHRKDRKRVQHQPVVTGSMSLLEGNMTIVNVYLCLAAGSHFPRTCGQRMRVWEQGWAPWKRDFNFGHRIVHLKNLETMCQAGITPAHAQMQ